MIKRNFIGASLENAHKIISRGDLLITEKLRVITNITYIISNKLNIYKNSKKDDKL